MLQKPRDLMATGPLPEEDAAIKRQVNRLHKSRPSDLSYMKRRHHLEWYRIRKDRSPDWRRRRNGLEDVSVRVTGAVRPAGATFVNLFDGGLMQNPSFMELTSRGFALTKVVVELTSNASHDLLKAGQLVLKVLQSIVENVYLGILLSNDLTKVATLTKS